MLCTPDGRALFLKRSDGDHAGTWAFPGGKIEDGETPEQAARRETEEETGFTGNDPLVQIDNGEFVTFRQDVAEFEPKLNEEHTEHRWARLDAPPEPLHPGVSTTLQKLAVQGHALDKREYDINNWFTVYDNPLSKAGVYPYRESVVVPGGDPTKMVGVLRPAEELASEACIKSFHLMPWIDEHPTSLLGDKEDGLVPAEQKGVHGVIGEEVYFKGDTLYGNVKVFSEALARKIASGKRELSCGYHCQFIAQTGVYEGQPYQYVQRNIRGNHVALVEKGRMGSDVRVLDAAERFTFSLDMKEPAMADESKKRDDEAKGTVSEETLKFIGDSFGSLVDELVKKGYSKEYATKIAGKVANEKGDSKDKAKDSEVKDPAGRAEDPPENEDLKPNGKEGGSADKAKDRAKDAKAKDAKAKDEEGAEAEEDEDGEPKVKSEDKARDRAKDKAKDAKGSGMDAAEIAALVDQRVRAIRQDAAEGHKLYQRLSPLVGAFDHADMTVKEMAAYGLKKLGQSRAADSADPVSALDCYLAALGASRESVARSAQDSASSGASFLDKYLAA